MDFNTDDVGRDDLSDNEAECSFEDVLEWLREPIMKMQSSKTEINEEKIEQMSFAIRVIARLIKGQDVKMSHELFEPLVTSGGITIEGPILEFFEPEWFARAAEFAGNTEVYPLVANRVRMTFTFHNVARVVG